MSSKRILSIGAASDYRLEPDYIEFRKKEKLRREEQNRLYEKYFLETGIRPIEIYTGIEGLKQFNNIMREALKNDLY
jgi:hypothetical protein